MTASAIAQILMVATLLLMITGKTPIYITAICGATISALVAGFPITGKEGMTIAKMVSSGLNPVIADMTGILLFIGIMQATGFMDVIIRDILDFPTTLHSSLRSCIYFLDFSKNLLHFRVFSFIIECNGCTQ